MGKISTFDKHFRKEKCCCSIVVLIIHLYLYEVCGFVSTVDGGFSEWSNWTTCSVVCGTGFQLRHRNCTSPSPAYGGKRCESKNFTEGRTCAMGPCQLPGNYVVVLLIVIIVVIFAQHECLRRRFTFLSRHWKKRKSQFFHRPCHITDIHKNLFFFVLTVDGGFSEWSNWTNCSVPCGTGFQLRHRNCSSPPPAHGGQGCESKNFTEGRICVIGPCHVPGNKVVGIIVVFFGCNRIV